MRSAKKFFQTHFVRGKHSFASRFSLKYISYVAGKDAQPGGLFQYEVVNIPELDMGTLMPLVMSLLGMGALRTFEKTKGISK